MADTTGEIERNKKTPDGNCYPLKIPNIKRKLIGERSTAQGYRDIHSFSGTNF